MADDLKQEGQQEGGELALQDDRIAAGDGNTAIGPTEAVPQWRDFYRAIRDAVSDMRTP